jgi:hypothetical protein
MNMSDRDLLVRAILAFDLMVKDCIDRESTGREFHDTAFRVLSFLAKHLKSPPDSDYLRGQYILNVTEISMLIKLIFCNSTVAETDLEDMLQLQSERLRWLGKHTKDEEESREKRKMPEGSFLQ